MKITLFDRQALLGFFEAAGDIRKPLVFASGFVALCALVLLLFWDEAAFVPRSYHALSLGMDMDTVDYVIGKPAQIAEGERFKDYALEKQADKYFSAHAFRTWIYPDGLTVDFNEDGKIYKIRCSAAREHSPCEPLLGLKIGDAEDLLTAKLGEGYESKIEDGRKIIYYPALNARFDLQKRKITGLELTDTSELIRK